VNYRLLSSLLFVCLLGASPAHAQRTPVSIVNHPNIPVATTKPVQAEQVKKAIHGAALRKGWTLADEAGDKMLATLVVRNKHTIMVEIVYSADKYSIAYRDSINMNYHSEAKYDSRLPNASANRASGPVIHPAYNTWVQELKDAIRIELGSA
jgi:hypothetical protein